MTAQSNEWDWIHFRVPVSLQMTLEYRAPSFKPSLSLSLFLKCNIFCDINAILNFRNDVLAIRSNAPRVRQEMIFTLEAVQVKNGGLIAPDIRARLRSDLSFRRH